MKYFKTTKSIKAALPALIVAILLAIGFYACKKPTEGINLIVNTGTLAKSPVLLHFSNAKAAATNQPGDFSVKITGRDAALVQMDGGSTDFKVSHGFLPLSLLQKSTPTSANPVMFNVEVAVAGYAPVLKQVIITDESSEVIEVKLLEYANLADGIGFASKTTALTAGTAGADVITVSSTATMPRKTTLAIAAGTQMLDGNGNVINASQLTSSVVHYGSETLASLLSFPGGLQARNVVDENGVVIPGGVNFVTAGCLDINMQAGSTKVKKFSKPVQVTEEIDPTIINFIAGRPIAVGDQIPLWSLNEETGQWKREATSAVVVKNADDKLAASFTIPHLSGWNLDWSWNCFGGFGTVTTGLTINLLPSRTPWISGGSEIELQTESGGYLIGFHGYVPQTDGFERQNAAGWYESNTSPGKYGFYLTQVPSIAKAKVAVYSPQGALIGQSAIFNPTTAGTVNVNVTVPPPPDYVDVFVNVKTRCTTKNIDTSPSGWYFMMDVSDYSNYGYTYFYLYNGVIYDYSYNNNGQFQINTSGVGGSIKLVNGHKYQMQTYYNNKWMYSEFIFTKGDFPLPAIEGLSGTAKYNAATNAVTINGTYNSSCN